VFIRALGRMRLEGRLPSGVRAVMAGAPQGRISYVREIIDSIAENALEDTIVMAEHVTDMPAAYLAADIVVSASTDPEAFGGFRPKPPRWAVPSSQPTMVAPARPCAGRNGIAGKAGQRHRAFQGAERLARPNACGAGRHGRQRPRPYRGEFHGGTHVRGHAENLPRADRTAPKFLTAGPSRKASARFPCCMGLTRPSIFSQTPIRRTASPRRPE